MKRRRVLVTGAGGFVGKALASGFADLGWEVIGLDRAFDTGWESRELREIRRVTTELDHGVPAEVPAVDLVVHAAWVTTDPGTLGITGAEYVTLNLRALLAVLEYTDRTLPAAFVFLSSSGVFAPEDAVDGLTHADHPTGSSPYAAAKRAGELRVSTALSSTELGSTAAHVVRLGYLFGPAEIARPSREGVSLVADWLDAARGGRPLPVRSDNPARDWTFTPDLAAALERVVDGPSASRPVHLASPHVWRDGAFADLITSQFPDAKLVTEVAAGRVKPPMVPSDIPALRDFVWTDPPAGLRVILARELAA